MSDHTTSKDRSVDHFHRLDNEDDLNPVDLAIYHEIMVGRFSHVEIVKPATIIYNCHGFALAPTHEGWYNVPDFFFTDDFNGTAMSSARPGDVLVYGSNGIVSHTSVVIDVDHNNIAKLQSKWGGVNEVRHSVKDVPEVYGEPIVLLRRRPGLPQHPAVSGEHLSVESPAEEMAQPHSEEPEGEQTNKRIPDRFMLMLASTPEVERQIRQKIESRRRHHHRSWHFEKRRSRVDSSTANRAENLETNTASEEPSALEAQNEIQKALSRFSSRDTQFDLLLASTPPMLREAAKRLEPVKTLIDLDETKPETRTAIVEFFEKPTTQADEEVTGITLFTLAKLPSKEAIVAIARYLETGDYSPFNGGLAVDALKEAIALPTS